jgi:hypothetical protein
MLAAIKNFTLIAGIVCIGCILLYGVNLFLARPRNDFASFGNAQAIKQYVLSNLTVGTSTLSETQDFMHKHTFDDDDPCSFGQVDPSHLYCLVKISDFLVLREDCIINYQFTDNVLTDVKVECFGTGF